MAEKLTAALAENLITLLAHNDEHGKVVANLVEPQLFEGDYRIIAEKCIEYWRVYHEAPKYHTPDLVGDILSDPVNRKAPTYRRILTSMKELSENVNTQFVLQQLQTFMRLQKFKDAILRSAEQLSAQQDMALPEVEELWHEILRTREFAFDPGIRLSEVSRVIPALDAWESEFLTGIDHLDRRGITPHRGTAFLFLGASGVGKTWAMVQIGKKALMQRKKVCHISLEMGQDQILQRYYQSIYAIPKHEADAEDVQITTIELEKGKLKGFATELVQPEFHFGSPNIEVELESHVKWMGSKFEHMIIKRFPPRALTPNGLRAYLDNLESVEHFVPDLLIIDSPYLMRIDLRNPRISIGHNYEECRAIAIERNLALVGTHQISRAGSQAATATFHHVAEDWSMVQTSDYIVTFTRTEMERQYGLGRLFVSKARDEKDKFGVLLTQNYALGQFCLESTYYLPAEYWAKLKEQGWYDNDDDDDDDKDTTTDKD